MVVEASVRELIVLDPTTSPVPVEVTMAPRPGTLDGKVMGLLDNAKSNAGRVLDLVGEIIATKYNLAGVVRKRKANASQGASEAMLDELAEECQFAIVGVGD